MVSIQSIVNMDDKPSLRTTLNLAIRQVSDISGAFETNGSVKTTVENRKVSPESVIIISARNAVAVSLNAFVEVAANGYFEVSHNNTAGGKFDYVIIGAM